MLGTLVMQNTIPVCKVNNNKKGKFLLPFFFLI